MLEILIKYSYTECRKARIKLDTKVAPTPIPWMNRPTQVTHKVLDGEKVIVRILRIIFLLMIRLAYVSYGKNGAGPIKR